MDSNNNERLPEELRGIPLDPRDVDAPGQGLSIYARNTPSLPSQFGWIKLLGYAAATAIAGATILKICAGNIMR